MSPTARTLAALRCSGWIACVVERFIEHKDIRIDAFGFADVLAAHPRDRKTMLVQATSLPNLSTRVAKVRSKPDAAIWLAAGGRIEVWGWTLRGQHWRVKRIEIEAETMTPVVIERVPRNHRRSRWQCPDLFGG